MSLLAPGVAHISFKGGGLFLPVRTPYDRQLLIDHVADRVRSKDRVQVLIDKRRWLVDRLHIRPTACVACGSKMDAACYDPIERDSLYCIGCVFGEPASQLHDLPSQRRSA